MKSTKYLICEAPLCVGAPTRGSEYALSHMMKGGLAELLESVAEFSMFCEELRTVEGKLITKKCDLLKYADPEGTEYAEGLRDAKTVMCVNRAHYSKLMKAHGAGYIPVTVGGDHSIAISTISALGDTVGCENIAVVYVDGHTDVNTEKSSESGYIHGMPLASVMGLCEKSLTVGENPVKVYGKNIYIIGARSIDKGEYPIMEKGGVHLYTAEDVKRRGAEAVLSEVAKAVKGKKVHLSFDVDVIDGEEFPATGYVMPGGLTFETTCGILEAVLNRTEVASLDIVEYNPSLDKDGECFEKMKRIFSLLK